MTVASSTSPVAHAERKAQRETFVLSAGESLLTAASLGEVVSVLRETAREAVGAEGIAVVLKDGDRCSYVAEDAVSPLWSGQSFPADSCVSGWAMRHARTVSISDVRQDDRVPQEAYARTFVRSLVMVPIGRPEPIAALGAYWSQVAAHDRKTIERVESLARLATIAVENARLTEARNRAAALGAAQNRILALAVEDAALKDTLAAIVREVEALSTSGVIGSILLLDEDGRHLRHGAAPSLSAEYNAAIDGIAVGAGVGSCGTAVHRGEPVFVADIAADPLWTEFRNLARAHRLRACWSVPIRSSAGKVLGNFVMYHREPREPQAGDLEIVDFVVRTAGLVIARSRHETALRRSEARYRQIVEGVEDFAIVTFDATGCVTGWNSGAEHVVGYTAAEAIGRPGDFFYTDEDQTAGEFAAECGRARREGRAVNERWHAGKGGARFWGSGLMMPLAMDHGGFVKMFRDRTAEREAEAVRLENEERLRLATESAEVGFWDVDEVNQVLHWPPIVKAMFGISADAPVSMQDFYDGLHPDDRDHASAAYAAAADPGRRALYDVEYRTVGKEDGVVRWVAAKGRGVFDAGGRCLRVVGTAIDISNRKVSEAALAASEARLRELNETLEQRIAEQTKERDRMWRLSRDPFMVADDQGRWVSASPVWTELLGWSEAELLGRTSEWMEHPDDHESTRSEVAHLAGGGTTLRHENRFRAKDGSYRCFSWTAVPEDGLIYAVARDVTDEKARQAELEMAQEALRQAQKMEAMGQLTGGVAHDFNNLLTPIVGALDMLQRRSLGGEREQRLIAGAALSADRAKTLVQRLLAFARRQPLQAVSVDVTKLVSGMGDLIASTTGPQIKVVVDAPEDLPGATADPNQLEMALLNLAVNARDAMPDGGTLRISASAAPVAAGHRSGLPAGDYICLSVADTGVGMDDVTLARAVEPFFSTKGVGKGTGLGLSMVHGLASQLNGTLNIQSRPGLGTNVELWLPRSQARPAEMAQSVANEAPSEKLGTALLVDDEELVRASTADMLMDLGYAVLEAASGEEALRLIESGRSFELLVTDHLMPGVSGTDLARLVRTARPDTAILLVSGYAEREGLDPDLPRLTKPFRKDDLAASLANLASKNPV